MKSKSVISFLFFGLFLLSVMSCDLNKAKRAADKFIEEYQEEEPKEAEKKPLLFYQRLLERFCQVYYDDCFSGRDYHSGSLIVDDMSVIQGNWENGVIVSWKMLIKGKHSFEGMFVNHNDSPFEAFVDDLGNDSYKVTFFIKRYDIFGDQMSDEESATRTITYVE